MRLNGGYGFLILGTLALAACQPAVPDSGAGVGFSDYNTYEADRAAREAALRGSQTGSVAPIAAPAVPNRPVISGEDLRSAGLPVGSGTSSGAPASAMAAGTTLPAAPDVATETLDTNHPRISDEQDFGAVAGRETIESDRERLAQQRQAYEVIQPTAVPSRPDGASGSNIVGYALSTTNAVGQAIYSRSGFNAQAKFLRACAQYPSSDRAQEDFLRNGGPQKDSKGLDPDGDGFACYWDPTPFRAAARNPG